MYGFSASGPGGYIPAVAPELVHRAFVDRPGYCTDVTCGHPGHTDHAVDQAVNESVNEQLEHIIIAMHRDYYVRANGPLLALMCDRCGQAGRRGLVTEVPTGTQLGELVVLSVRHERHEHR